MARRRRCCGGNHAFLSIHKVIALVYLFLGLAHEGLRSLKEKNALIQKGEPIEETPLHDFLRQVQLGGLFINAILALSQGVIACAFKTPDPLSWDAKAMIVFYSLAGTLYLIALQVSGFVDIFMLPILIVHTVLQSIVLAKMTFKQEEETAPVTV